jgi:hypothetical protein
LQPHWLAEAGTANSATVAAITKMLTKRVISRSLPKLNGLNSPLWLGATRTGAGEAVTVVMQTSICRFSMADGGHHQTAARSRSAVSTGD